MVRSFRGPRRIDRAPSSIGRASRARSSTGMAAHREPEMLTPVGAMRRARETLELFGRVGRNADLRRVILAWAASNLASRASAIAVAVFAYQAGGAGAVGIIAFVRLVSTALLAPV